jgi:hypothetical protein
MAEFNEDDEIIETELKMLRNKLNGIYDTLKISMGCIIVLLVLIFLVLWFSPSF